MKNYIIKTNFNKNETIFNGNKFLIGNIYLGVRGTLDEHTKEDMVSINIPLVYDQVGDKWREPVNAFNPLFLTLYKDENELSTKTLNPTFHEQSLNIYEALHKRITTYNINNIDLTLKSERFVSEKHKKLIVSKYKLTASKDITITLKTGIDTNIYEANGPHYKNIEPQLIDDVLVVDGTTQEKKHKITAYEKFITDFDEKIITYNDGIFRLIKLDLKQNETYEFYKYSYVSYQDDFSLDKFKDLSNNSYNSLYNEHKEIFKSRWHYADVKISGNDEADLALRYSIYHLLLIAPRDRIDASIPARGISGQTYKGAIFWDTEMFMLPFYLNNDLESAKQIINYRINTIKGARIKAREYGFKGAYYAWESQENGHEACTDYNVTDVFTNRLVRTYFRDKQIHINAAIVYAIINYYNRTKDLELLFQASEIIIESAIFYYDYSYINPNRQKLEFLDVLGPDEYHERVNNNAYTNKMVKYTFDALGLLLNLMKSNDKSLYNETLDKYKPYDLLNIVNSKDNVYLQKPNEEGIIEQFDGYFKLNEISIEDLLSQILHPNEYLGGYGLAGDTQVIKQADVIAMLQLFNKDYEKEVVKKNFDYYLKRTEHGSSLSSSMYALVACSIGLPDYAYDLFLKSAKADLIEGTKQYAGGIYIGGTHPAASGGAYMSAVYGFTQLDFIDGKPSVKSNLPKNISGIEYRVIYNNNSYYIKVDKNNTSMRKEDLL